MKEKTLIMNYQALQAVSRVSPKGKYAALRRDLSGALEASGDPFDVEHVIVPAGKTNFPYHSHAAMWEFYWVVSGSGVVRTPSGVRQIVRGDFFRCEPGEPHQISASENEAIEYLVIANNTAADLIHYPDSGKWNAKPGMHIFREDGLDYYLDEE